MMRWCSTERPNLRPGISPLPLLRGTTRKTHRLIKRIVVFLSLNRHHWLLHSHHHSVLDQLPLRLSYYQALRHHTGCLHSVQILVSHRHSILPQSGHQCLYQVTLHLSLPAHSHPTHLTLPLQLLTLSHPILLQMQLYGSLIRVKRQLKLLELILLRLLT